MRPNGQVPVTLKPWPRTFRIGEQPACLQLATRGTKYFKLSRTIASASSFCYWNNWRSNSPFTRFTSTSNLTIFSSFDCFSLSRLSLRPFTRFSEINRGIEKNLWASPSSYYLDSRTTRNIQAQSNRISTEGKGKIARTTRIYSNSQTHLDFRGPEETHEKPYRHLSWPGRVTGNKTRGTHLGASFLYLAPRTILLSNLSIHPVDLRAKILRSFLVPSMENDSHDHPLTPISVKTVLAHLHSFLSCILAWLCWRILFFVTVKWQRLFMRKRLSIFYDR